MYFKQDFLSSESSLYTVCSRLTKIMFTSTFSANLYPESVEVNVIFIILYTNYS